MGVLTGTGETQFRSQQIRQYRGFSIEERPAAARDIATKEEFTKSQNYNRDLSRFAFFKNAWDYLLTTVTWLFFVMPWLWSFSGSLLEKSGYFPDSEIAQSIVFFTIGTLANRLLDIPWELYSTFVIEEKHGFNKKTIGLYISDLVKTYLLSITIGSAILAGLIAIISRTGPMFPIYVWAFLFVFKILAITIYPTLIQPCFNKVEPLPEGSLRTQVEELAASVEFPLKKLFTIDGSKRSAHSNAYMYGFFKNKRIVIFDTLIEQCSEKQIVAVLGHELGHWKLNHTVKMLCIGEVQTVVLFALFQQVMNTTALYLSFGFNSMPILIGLILFGQLYSPVAHVIQFALNAFSRHNEFEADEFSKSLGYGKELHDALIVMAQENLSNLVPDKWYSTYHYSHPPILERLSALSVASEKQKKDN